MLGTQLHCSELRLSLLLWLPLKWLKYVCIDLQTEELDIFQRQEREEQLTDKRFDIVTAEGKEGQEMSSSEGAYGSLLPHS